MSKKYFIQEETLTDVADSVRALTGSTGAIALIDMPTIIANASGGEDPAIIEEVLMTVDDVSIVLKDKKSENDIVSSTLQGTYSNFSLTSIQASSIINDVLGSEINVLYLPNLTSTVSNGSLKLSNMTNLMELILPKATNSCRITGSFDECPYLTTINLDSRTYISSSAFSGLRYLKNVSLKKCTEIPMFAFMDCVSLTEIHLPSLAKIDYSAFYLSGLTNLYLEGNSVVSLTDEYAFYLTPLEYGEGHIYVPANLVNQYKNATNWSAFADYIVALPEA